MKKLEKLAIASALIALLIGFTDDAGGKTMNQDELNRILELHEKWIKDEDGGVKADLSYADLIGADLSYADLIGADLSDADLRHAKLSYANLIGADLSYADLIGADLSDADLSYAKLSGADLSYANLSGADLSYANLIGADLRHACLDNVKCNDATAFYHLQCPEKGSYVGYKKCRDNRIVELLIPEDAKRSSATTRKCRASKAKVLSITNIDGTENFEETISCYNPEFFYKVGEIVEVEDFDENRWNGCSTGIHHFITRDEAVNYCV